jgi:hypothetical protein
MISLDVMRMRTSLVPILLASLSAFGLVGCDRSPPQVAAPPASAAGPATRLSAATASAPGAAELAQGKRAFGEIDPARALGYFLEAAKKGNAEAQYYAGLMLADGQGVSSRDVNAAAKLYAQAAAQGQPDAMYQLARLHVLGVGVEADVPRAIELFDKAARAFPPGERRNLAIQQRDALVALSQGKPGQEQPPPAARPGQ